MGHATDLATRQQAEDRQQAQHHEADDRNHLDQREPELELAVVLHAEQVGRGQQQGNDQGKGPDRHIGEPGMQDGRGGVGLQRDHQHPEPPVQPADGETGPVPDGTVGVGRKGTGIRRGHSHFGEHAHHQHHQGPGGGVGHQYSGAGFGNRVPGADKQPRTDHPGNRQHGHMPRFQALLQVVGNLRPAH